MKKFIALAVICHLILVSLSIASTGAENLNVELFTHEHLASYQELAGCNTRQIVMLGDTLYAYLDNAKVYSWRISEPGPRMFCQLPELPEGAFPAYDRLGSGAKARLDKIVSCLATGDDALWGINVFSGKIGKITTDGIQWNEIQLDVTRLMPEGVPWPLRVVRAFVANNTLYTYVAMDDGVYPQNNYEMLAFDLSNGSCSVLDIHNAQGICEYKPGAILLLQPTDENTWTMQEMNLSTGTISESPFPSFPSARDKPIGGLAFDPVSDRLFFTTVGQVWSASQGEAYAPGAFVPVTNIVGETIAFALEDGRYALYFGGLHVRGVEAALAVPDMLRLEGCVDQTIYESFSRENPNIPVDISDRLIAPDEIVQLMVSGDPTADVYATFADQTFRALAEKGYAADLSSSAVLSSDIQTMYPNIQRIITDQAGNPVAYPFQLLLGNWQVDEALWRHIFGDAPLPKTYDQFLDAMVLWESTYADAHPEIDFAMNFDHAYWVRSIVNAFAQQYGQPNLPLDISSPVLRNVLQKLEQVRDIRMNNERNIQSLDDGEFMPKPEIFITAGFNNVLLDPVTSLSKPQAELVELDDVLEEGIYIDMPALVFTEGEQPLIPGKMIVWFVNPYSPRKELAIRYLEHAARMKNNDRTYYATHPDVNDPLVYEGYELWVLEMEQYRDVLKESLEEAEGIERLDIQSNLKDVENLLSNQDRIKWTISENAIANYRAFAPSIRFFEDNRYVIPEGSTFSKQLEGLYQRYADGVISLDAFLSEINAKMRMLFLEGE